MVICLAKNSHRVPTVDARNKDYVELVLNRLFESLKLICEETLAVALEKAPLFFVRFVFSFLVYSILVNFFLFIALLSIVFRKSLLLYVETSVDHFLKAIDDQNYIRLIINFQILLFRCIFILSNLFNLLSKVLSLLLVFDN